MRIVVNPPMLRGTASTLDDAGLTMTQEATRLAGKALPEMPGDIAGTVADTLTGAASRFRGLFSEAAPIAADLRLRALEAEIADVFGVALSSYTSLFKSLQDGHVLEDWEIEKGLGIVVQRALEHQIATAQSLGDEARVTALRNVLGQAEEGFAGGKWGAALDALDKLAIPVAVATSILTLIDPPHSGWKGDVDRGFAGATLATLPLLAPGLLVPGVGELVFMGIAAASMGWEIYTNWSAISRACTNASKAALNTIEAGAGDAEKFAEHVAGDAIGTVKSKEEAVVQGAKKDVGRAMSWVGL